MEEEKKSKAFIVLYGQLRKDPSQLFSRFLRPLLSALDEQKYDTRVVAHQWFSHDMVDTRVGPRAFPEGTANLRKLVEVVRPDVMRVDRPRDFGAVVGKVSTSTLSQMYSRTRARDLLEEILQQEGVDADEAPVFFCRSDFGNEVPAQILEEYLSATGFFYLSGPWKFNDNFIVMSASEFCIHFQPLKTYQR